MAADSAATPRPVIVMTSQASWGCTAHEQPDPGTTAAHPSTTSGSRSRRAAETAGKLTNSSEFKKSYNVTVKGRSGRPNLNMKSQKIIWQICVICLNRSNNKKVMTVLILSSTLGAGGDPVTISLL